MNTLEINQRAVFFADIVLRISFHSLKHSQGMLAPFWL